MGGGGWGQHSVGRAATLTLVVAGVGVARGLPGTIRPPPLLVSTSKAAVESAFGDTAEATKSVATQVRGPGDTPPPRPHTPAVPR